MQVKCKVVDINTAGNGTYVKLLVKEPSIASGRIDMVVTNKVLSDQFALGQEYLVEIKAVK